MSFFSVGLRAVTQCNLAQFWFPVELSWALSVHWAFKAIAHRLDKVGHDATSPFVSSGWRGSSWKHKIRSSSVDAITRPPPSSSLNTNRSFRHASPCLWNQLSVSFRQLHCTVHDSDTDLISHMPVHVLVTTKFTDHYAHDTHTRNRRRKTHTKELVP